MRSTTSCRCRLPARRVAAVRPPGSTNWLVASDCSSAVCSCGRVRRPRFFLHPRAPLPTLHALHRNYSIVLVCGCPWLSLRVLFVGVLGLYCNPVCIGVDFHRAMVATGPGGKLFILRRPVRKWTQMQFFSSFHFELRVIVDVIYVMICSSQSVNILYLAFILKKINKNCSHQSCSFSTKSSVGWVG